ncbi:hypothetical protein GCM10023184_19050 [Flaviaesturariibacter amylovorans]|uniref:Sulfatase N-terminal domain-containing protein n=1 Tax=Flaviaesturariibacter amylovorans TaxID=1084520 RepID=A0ABP8GRL3_9BACT
MHNPLQAPKPLIAKYAARQKALGIPANDRFAKDEDWMRHESGWRRRRVQDHPAYAAMIENMDWNIGRLIDKLRASGLDSNTLVIFTSDNGGLSTAEGSPTTNAPLRAGKGWLYEGGIRVPLIVYWKGRAEAGAVSELPVNSADLFTTIAKAINARNRKGTGIDGEDLFELLTRPGASKSRPLFWHYPHYSNQGGRPGAAIREGAFKLVYHYEEDAIELFNIDADIAEKKDLATTHRRIAGRLKRKLFQWLDAHRAARPAKNPGYVANPASAAKPLPK